METNTTTCVCGRAIVDRPCHTDLPSGRFCWLRVDPEVTNTTKEITR